MCIRDRTYTDYYINKNPDTYHPHVGTTYGEDSSYEFGSVSGLNYDFHSTDSPVFTGNFPAELQTRVQIVSGDTVPQQPYGIGQNFTDQYKDQLKGIERNRYQIKLDLWYRKYYTLLW